MLDCLRSVIDSIPLDVVAFVGPPAIWAKVAWASPFVKTYRHGVSGLLSLFTGLLMAAALRSDEATWPIYFIAAVVSLFATFFVLLWPGKRNVR
jgi:uncharacterized membrane protein